MLTKSNRPKAIPKVDVPSSRGSEDWRQDAACAGMPPKISDRLYFPLSESKEATSVGLEICHAVCPVREACKAWAMANEKRSNAHGILGGHTAAERRTLYRADGRYRRLEREAALQEEEVSALADALSALVA